MSTRSDKVKRWRQRSKQAIIEAMGGKCILCGYNKCNSALALHHIDPSKKEISFGGMRSNPKRWETIAKELNKCCIVCHNCHSEIHDGMVDESLIVCTYNDEYKRKSFIPTPKMDDCPICGRQKPEYNITCSRECAAKRSMKVDWDNIDIIDLVDNKKQSFCRIADQLGVSDMAVRKRYKKLKNDLTPQKI